MAIFNYQNYLNVDDDTYADWSGTIEELESSAVNRVQRLNPTITIDTTNKNLYEYAKEVIYIGIFGDTLTPALWQYHDSKMSDLEEYFRWWQE